MEMKALLGMCFLLLSAAQASSLVRLQSGTIDPEKFVYDQKQTENTNTWIVSYGAVVTEKMKKQAREQGYKILGFLPDTSLILKGDSKPKDLKDQVAAMPFLAAWKWSRELQSPSVLNQSVYRVVMIRCHTAADAKRALHQIESLEKVFVLNNTDSFLVVRATYSDLFKISNYDEVAFLSELPDFQTMQMDMGFSPNSVQINEVTGFETGTKVMNFEDSWAAGFKGEGQVVAMGDTGVDRGDAQNIHVDLAGSILSGKNFAPFGRSWEDPMGHGTHVAGSVLSRGVFSGGVFKGGAHEAKLVVHSLWSPMLNNLMVPTKLSDMFQSAVSSGASVHTNSWGQAKNFGGYDSFARQVDEFMFNNPDLLILFAAGNSGVDANKDGRIDGDSIGSPGTAKNTLTVGASENYELSGGIQRTVSELRPAKESWPAEPLWSSKLSDHPNGLAVFSSRGPTDDGRIKPEIVAPGTNILSTFSHHPKAEVLWGKYNDEYVWSGGTSMATPLAAGAAAVTRQILQKNFKLDKPTSSLMKAFMISFASDLYPGQFGEMGSSRGQEILSLRPNNDEGFGLVNMKAQVLANEQNTFVFDQKTGLATNETQEFPVVLAHDGKITVTLVWNDAPAAEAAGRALVNDLNLEVVGGDIQFASNDSVNNFEFFEKTARAGQYKVRVLGHQIPQGKSGKQPYSLVIRVQ